MTMSKHIKTFQDLITSHTSVKEGFLAQAIEKGQKSRSYIHRAEEFRKALSSISSIDDLISLSEFREELMAAAGFSEKALNHLSEKEKRQSLQRVLKQIRTQDNFKEELVQRYLLTKGDSLGGAMRNFVGFIAAEKFVNALSQTLELRKTPYSLEKNKNDKIQTIKWNGRYLVFDHTPKWIGKNIDVILFDTNVEDERLLGKRDISEEPSRYLACGELKGGIDPAGADEHWKTANSSLDRIRTCFKDKKNKPALFFAGAAIESSMAQEIFEQLQSGKLTRAANLHSDKQVRDLIQWLIDL